ncbi:protein-tyrosine phosphatase-like protein [Lentinula aciculospora]|uniref:Protein-tyrosine phosphatase-like protein n=1 Tax=Lentinula aciculospora TaxID=153920 RepID=A0A9W9A3W8_9AGAR|nr:protein-tyrosine phosphatase-like protein [Lentinula aciculospora]
MPSASFMEAWANIAQKTSLSLASKDRASLIIPRLYLSDLATAVDEEIMQKLGVTHVVSILDWAPEFLASIPAPHRLHIRLADSATSDILAHLDTTTHFVRRALEGNESNVVLVHCFQGISRSATVICAYLISTAGMTAMESINFVQSKRRIASPNNGFRKQLHLYTKRVRGNTDTVETESTEENTEAIGGVQKTKVFVGSYSESPW